jgi:thiol-disulfide isomerase/thioredoxin
MLPDLPIGSPAPSIEMLTWIYGNPISAFQPGKIYIIELFATTCGYCPDALTGLGRLQEKYGDVGVEVFAVAANERAETADAARVQVNTWLNKEVPNSQISIAFDLTGKMQKHWSDASGSIGVPLVFVVDRDRSIAFIGRPQSLDHVLPKVIDGTWCTSAEGKQSDKERLAEGQTLTFLSRTLAAMNVKDSKTALSAIEEGINAFPDNLDFRRFHADILIGEMHNMEAAWIALGRFARDAIEKNSEDWLLAAMRQLFGSPYDYSCLPFAERFSMGKELSDRILTLCPQWDARSRALSYAAIAPYYHENGKSERAVELIEEALELVEGESLADDVKQEWLAQLLQALEKYKA